MRIFYFSKYVTPPSCGPVGQRGYLLMKEVANRGFDTTIVCSKSNHLANFEGDKKTSFYSETDNFKFYALASLKYGTVSSINRILSWIQFEFALLRKVRKFKLRSSDTVIVSSLSILTLLSGIIIKRLFRCKLVVEIRDIWPLTLVEEGDFGPKNPFIFGLQCLERMAYMQADLIIGTMPNLGEHVASVSRSSAKVECIPMGITTGDLENALRAQTDSGYRLANPDKFTVGHVGSIGSTNALAQLFEVASKLQDYEDIEFLVVGSGDLEAQYRQQYKHLDNVTFAPAVKKEDVQSVLASCDLLFFATHNSKVWKYGQSLNKLIDYMLSGKVIVGAYSGFPSMVSEAECGVFIRSENIEDLEEAILKFSRMDVVERNQIGKRGADWLRKHRHYDQLADKYIELMLKLHR